MSTITVMYVSFAFYRDRAPGADVAQASPPRVSMMVAVKDDVDTIESCVLSMLDSRYPDLQVIVVDDGSTDGTIEVLRALRETREFELLVLPKNVGKKRALVEAAARADGDVLVFTDSDCIVAPDAVAQCVKALTSRPDIGAVSGHARALNGSLSLLTTIQDTWYDGQFAVAKAAESVFGSVTCVSGPLAAFRREAIYNYFPAWANDRFLGQEFRFATDRQLTGYVLGQQRVGRRLKAANADSPFVSEVDYPERFWRVEYVASARVLTNVPVTFRSFFKQQIRWKKSFIRSTFFSARFVWRRGVMPALLWYSHILWVAVAPILAFRHLLWAPVHGWWALTGLYLFGVLLKGAVWAVAYKAHHPHSHRWVFRPLMSVISAVCLSWLLPYAALTLRKSVWSRG